MNSTVGGASILLALLVNILASNALLNPSLNQPFKMIARLSIATVPSSFYRQQYPSFLFPSIRRHQPLPLRQHHFQSMMILSSSSSSSTNIPSGKELQQQEQQQQRTLAEGSHLSEYEIKKSRFLGYTRAVTNWKEAQTYIAEIKQEHPKARHWCFGYVAGQEERCSDDGEPTGTAGVPILGAIKGEGLSNAVCVIVRYFGGIKLGAGGLIRAYGAAARQVLREAPTIPLIPTSSFRTTVPTSSWAGAIYDAASKVPGTSTCDECYAEDGSFRIDVACHTDQLQRLQTILLDATRGSAVFSTVPATFDDEHVEQHQEDD